jgi:hypothetical protein
MLCSLTLRSQIPRSMCNFTHYSDNNNDNISQYSVTLPHYSAPLFASVGSKTLYNLEVAKRFPHLKALDGQPLVRSATVAM